jgi:membrane protease YdiL (CAAX protease family)
MSGYKTILRSLLRAGLYYAAIALFAQIAVELNYRYAPRMPIAFLLGVLLVVAWAATLGRRWSGYPLLKVAVSTGGVALYAGLAVLCCVGVFIWVGKLSHLVSGFPPAPEGSGVSWRISAALFTATFAAITEEVAFRGILQGDLVVSLSPRLAIAISTLVFCALHVWRVSFMAQLPFYAALGLSAALVAHITQSVAPGMAIHLATNTLLAAAALVWGPIEWVRLSDFAFMVALVVSIFAAAGMLFTLQRLRALSIAQRTVA